MHYEERDKEQKTYTSQVAESHIESIINARHNKSGKMQWTRAGAHKVLQIRGVIASNAWEDRWQVAVLSALEVAVYLPIRCRKSPNAEFARGSLRSREEELFTPASGCYPLV